MQTDQRDSSPSHSYETAGDYQVKISGAFPGIYCNADAHCQKLRSVDQWGDNEWMSMEKAFMGAKDLQILANDVPNLTRVRDMIYMFAKCQNLTGKFSGWDVSSVTNMSYMFA